MSSQRVEPTTSITANDFGVPDVNTTGIPKRDEHAVAQRDLSPQWTLPGVMDWRATASDIVEQDAVEDAAGGGN
ncbi:hypothetical protein PC9H_008141 [Pleurotus ostreatus]|uniref:Uncharacterized protein n=1 Tax=Pleurotus ostreatus TaxID=5322 RepID=A0A8H6ZZJ2_PLEOS|nr:uncharacterized protein PC9H_008141 [Pleurotus ostreatus]KAF7428907.1 hypothetical protein PC9H_008141 [Pleurotus ostreatus]